jgi:predicted NAD/FAD-dependent oxidoreductase
MEPWDVVVVGAGVCGITLARLLDEAGQRVLLLDKGRLPGGRVASKTLEGSVLDTAANQVTTDDREVMSLLTRFAGARWQPDDAGSVLEASRWNFAEPARKIMQGFAGTLPLQHTFVSHLVREGVNHLGVKRHGFGEPVWARRVVLTMPVPQAQAIIAHSDFLLDYDLDTVDYTKRQVLLAVFEGDGQVPDSAWSTDMVETIRYRPRLDGMLGVEAFASEAWSGATWDQDATISQGRLLRELGMLFDDARVWGSDLVRWRYALPRVNYDAPFWSHPNIPGLYMAGDAFGGGVPSGWGVARAVASGLELAKKFT